MKKCKLLYQLGHKHFEIWKARQSENHLFQSFRLPLIVLHNLECQFELLWYRKSCKLKGEKIVVPFSTEIFDKCKAIFNEITSNVLFSYFSTDLGIIRDRFDIIIWFLCPQGLILSISINFPIPSKSNSHLLLLKSICFCKF